MNEREEKTGISFAAGAYVALMVVLMATGAFVTMREGRSR